ncbi:MAG TPA: hypothetical protein VMW44_00785 [Candidatus Bathyarchaeia archaeon]|nr:hypothetical protein [Candidatus Bathyarchaeia archaeon]
MGLIDDDILDEIKKANEDGNRLLPLLEYAITQARERFFSLNSDREYLPVNQKGDNVR